jgi:hypothetical protein
VNPRNEKRRDDAHKHFEEAQKLAADNKMVLRPLAFANGDPGDITQYRITGPDNTWFKDVYPGSRRIYCPDRAKQGPFVGMPKDRDWTLVDFVRACVKAMHADMKYATRHPELPGQETVVITGDATDNRLILRQMIDKITMVEGTTHQAALRDLLTDLRHVVDVLKLDIEEALKGSYEVYCEEESDPEFFVWGEPMPVGQTTNL